MRSLTTILTTIAGFVVAVILLTIAASIHAESPRAPISVADIEARGAQIFADADIDGDGLVTEAEFSVVERGAHRRGPGAGGPGKRWQHAEASAEHRLNIEDQLFDQLDADDDDMLSREEFSMANQRAARKSIGRELAFARLDENADGVLSPDEFPPRRLANLDSDGDGELSREELKQRRGNRYHNDG